ncbi:hypothetical protein [Vulcanisaeta souniana]|uniref:Uncharacterized protein n=1 Tax=Vulcanisaeta souniana JCM 11219 TaxID=1293586 RepID=A0ABN6SNF3_9CREN|nr:hypothetical protein [Vulcanisaeta souniana]BDR90924.1 hypothetical protein Vsou_00170 [Vulcanisaeta souniana JCM 11219]
MSIKSKGSVIKWSIGPILRLSMPVGVAAMVIKPNALITWLIVGIHINPRYRATRLSVTLPFNRS